MAGVCRPRDGRATREQLPFALDRSRSSPPASFSARAVKDVHRVGFSGLHARQVFHPAPVRAHQRWASTHFLRHTPCTGTGQYDILNSSS